MENQSDSLTAGKPDFQPILRRSATDDVAERLAAMISSGQLKVDERLPSEAQLAGSFQVGRSVVREALGRLKALGMVASRSGSGTFVSSKEVDLTLTFGGYSARELNEVRHHLELHTAALAAQRRSPDHLKRLGHALSSFERTATASDRQAMDVTFHVQIAHATGNRLFARLIEDIRGQIIEQSRAISTLERIAQASVEHRAIYEAIGRKDREAAIQAMRTHLDAVEATLTASHEKASTGTVRD